MPRAFDRALRSDPAKIAQIDVDGSWTYEQAYARSLVLAGGLRNIGIERGLPVLTMVDSHLDATHLWQGAGLTGLIEVPINTAYKGTFLSHIVNDSRADTLVLDAHYGARVAAVATELTELRTVVVRGVGDDAADASKTLADAGFRILSFGELLTAKQASPVDVAPWDLMNYIYTSGTTGRSKGVRVSHAHGYTYASREDQGPPTAADRILVTLPLFHMGGKFYGMYQALIAQACAVLKSGFSLSEFWDQVREHEITFTLVVGAMAQLLSSRPESADDADTSLRAVAMMPVLANIDSFAERFGMDVYTGFGMTEAGAPVIAGPGSLRPGEAGFPRPGFEVKVVDEHDIEVPSGVTGELVVRPELPWTVMDGYVGLPETAATMWRNGWLHTGDGFRHDSDGRLFFVDRIKDALRRRGENISSFEVEEVVTRFDGVLECAVVAVPSELTEDEIKAVIVLKPGAEPDPVGLTRFLVDALPYFMVPRYLEFVSELPKTPTQKVRKHVLREAGIGSGTWDRDAAGIVVTRRG